MRQKVPISIRLECCKNRPGIVKQVKTGYMLRYKKRIFGKDWREEYVVLYNDSSLCWYRDRTKCQPDGGLLIRDAPHMIAVGQWTCNIPYRPELPYGCTASCLLAFGTQKKEKVHWFLCKDADEVNSWMTAISNTLPPPPKPVCVQAAAQIAAEHLASAPPHHQSGANVTQSLLPPNPMTTYYSRRYPTTGQTLYGTSGPQHTTVLVRDSKSSDHGFTSGILTGAMMSNVAAGGWGPMYGYGLGPHWGGWGFGMGWVGGGLNRSALHYSDTDIRVNNYYDNDTTTVIHNDFHDDCGQQQHYQEVSNHGDVQSMQYASSSMTNNYVDDNCDDDFDGDFGGDDGGYDAGGGFDFF